MKDRILFVGGSWDLDGGKPSKVVNEFAKKLDNVDLYNGGNYFDLDDIIHKAKDYNVVFWWANVDNNLPKIRNIKEINNRVMLISSKRNDNDKYNYQQLLQRSLDMKANLTVEFSKKDNLFRMRVFDPLGNVWYEGYNIDECIKSITGRLSVLKKITRESTYRGEEINYNNSGNEEFLNIVRDYASKFSITIFPEEVKRFLGNASFRCLKGFPSFRGDNCVFVSKRNVNKEYISIDEFVLVYEKDGKIYYCGENKPSVDTPIQVKLYNKFPNINYMIHSHCYIDNAPYTECKLPCGALEEVEEIDKLINDYYDGDYNRDFYIFNLSGHGSIMMSNDPKKLERIKLSRRDIFEKDDVKKLIKK